MKKKFLFYFCNGIGSVFDSQVLELLSSIKESQYFQKIFLFLGIKDESQKKDIYKKNLPEIEINFYKTYPNYPLFNYLNRESIKSSIKKIRMDFNDIFFHVRGEITAWYLKQVLGNNFSTNVLIDIRGASIEEIIEFSGMNRILRQMKLRNYKMALNELLKINMKSNNSNKSYIISVVSKSLKNYLIDNFSANANSITIIPCLAGSKFKYNEINRIKTRKILNLEDEDFLLVFSSSGTALWQNSDVLLTLAEKGIKVLNLSPKEYRHKNIINKFVQYQDVPAYLSASDAAIIWRNESIVNKVASPVKFSEYVCCGLPVISNSSVDQIKEFILTEDCGLIIENLNDLSIEKLRLLKLKDRNSIAKKGREIFGIEAIVDKYLTTYSLMCKK